MFKTIAKIGTQSSQLIEFHGQKRTFKVGDRVMFREQSDEKWTQGRVWLVDNHIPYVEKI